MLLFFSSAIPTYAENLVFDYKYVKVGVVCNEWDNQLGSSPNIRQLGTTTSPENYGKNVFFLNILKKKILIYKINYIKIII